MLGVDLTQMGRPDYTNPEVANQKEIFEEWLFSCFEEKNTSFVMNLAELNSVREVLLGKKQLKTAGERFSLKKKNYTLVNDKVARNVKGITKLVVPMEEFFEIIYRVHASNRLHQGILIKKN